MIKSAGKMAAILIAVGILGTTGQVAFADEPVWTSGEIRKVDLEQGKITVRHEEIVDLDMPAMSMVFAVTDATLLEGLEEGDVREFHFIDQNGRLMIEQIRVPE